MLSGTIRVFHESKNATLALRGCTHFENIRRRESHFSQKKHPQKTGISTMINGLFWKMNPQGHHYGVPRVQKDCSCLTRLHPLREHSSTGITLFLRNHPQKTDISTMINGVFWKMNAQWHHYGVPRVQNATLALRGCTHFENIRRRDHTFPKKIILKNPTFPP